MVEDSWFGCYGGSLKAWLVPAAFQHPAKFSRKLIERIYAHALEEGWLVPGQRVLDPMAGVATGAIPAANAGLQWEGIELEVRFVEAGCATLEKHRRVWEQMGKPMPVLRQGDARQLGLDGADCVVSSPPYAAVISSPPFADANQTDRRGLNHPMQLEKLGGRPHGAWGKPTPYMHPDTPGQLGALPVGDVQAVITSPPYVGGGRHPDQTGSWGGRQAEKAVGLGTKAAAGYGGTPGQIGRMPEGQRNRPVPENYWSSMRQVYANCFALLPPGGHILLVVKGFIRTGQYRDLPAQTCQLLEAIGFRVVHRHRAWLIAKAAQARLDGGEDRRAFKSFYRRIQERKGSPAIDFEEVVCAEKSGEE